MLDFFPEYAPERLDSRAGDITLRHLLTMTAGFDWSEERGWKWPAGDRSWMHFALRLPIAAPPGQQFTYNTPGAHVLSGVLARATGMATSAFAQRYLFGPLGIEPGLWPDDPEGYTFGGHGLHLTVRDLAKIGCLYLNGGSWGLRPVVSSGWVTEAAGRPAYYVAGYGGQ